MDDLEQKIKLSLLEDLIEKMGEQSGDRLKPKEMSVSVAAPDKSKLAEGLDKAKDVLGSAPGEDAPEHSEEDDEQRLLALLGEDDSDEDDKAPFEKR